MAEQKRMEQWLLEANDKSLLKPTLKKDKFLPDYINRANLIFYYIVEKAETGIFLKDLTVSTTLHHNTVAVYCRILAKLNLIRPQKIGRQTLYLYNE
jgi:hypothetical protein